MKDEAFFDSLFFFLANPNSTVGVFWFLMKILYLVGFGLYVLFAGVVVRQVTMMTNTYQTGAELFLKTVAMVHFVIAIGVLILAFLIL